MLPPINLKKWIEDNRDRLKPPVCNQLVYQDTDFMIMIIGSPNIRDDYHINRTEEFFYQIQGEMNLRIRSEGKPKDIIIKEGEMFLLPPSVPHSPQRPEGSVGMVIERHRGEGQLDGFQWFCKSCNERLYEEFFPLENIVEQLPPLFERFYSDPEKHTCKKCGAKNLKPGQKDG